MVAAVVMSDLFFTVTTMPLTDTPIYSNNTLFIPRWKGSPLAADEAPNDYVCFVGGADNLDPGVLSVHAGTGNTGGTDCSKSNGCGVHVHAGFSCENSTTQGGHWYNSEKLDEDPWAIVGYLETDADGNGVYADCVRTGFDLVNEPDLLVGRAFIVHAEDGSRMSCGLIEESTMSAAMPTALEAETTPVPGAVAPAEEGIVGAVQVLSNVQSSVVDGVCYQGWAQNLEADVESFLLGTGSQQCNVTNGCGAHIHAGTGCEDKDEQGGHFYDSESIAADPWLLASYYSTDNAGNGAYVGCVITGDGAVDYKDRPFIVHGTDGSRQSCGILVEAKEEEPESRSSAESSSLGYFAAAIAVGAGLVSTIWQ